MVCHESDLKITEQKAQDAGIAPGLPPTDDRLALLGGQDWKQEP
jgi:hypothetical protein